VPQGLFKESDDFSAILKTIVDLESGNSVSSSEAQLQSSSQALLNECDVVLQSPRRRTSQSAPYSDFVREEFKCLLVRRKARADAASESGCDYDRVRYRNWLSSINDDSGAWLSAGVSSKMFEMSSSELVSAICRRNAVEDLTTPKYTLLMSRENPQFYCACDGGSRPKSIDPYGYHLVGCEIGANAIRLHGEVVSLVAKPFGSLRVDAIVEPMHLFADAAEDASNQRPDAFLRNPRGLGRQAIIDVAVTGVDGQSRTSDEAAERPMQVRYDQKMAKYGRVAEQNNLRLTPAVFSYTGQIYGEFKSLVKEQSRHKLTSFEGEAKSSKVRSVMKWWSKRIYLWLLPKRCSIM